MFASAGPGGTMRAANYDIVIDGELPPELAVVFAPHRVNRTSGTSTIVAEQVDQAALLWILTRATDLALTLVRVERVERH
jgi:hypothetical protein